MTTPPTPPVKSELLPCPICQQTKHLRTVNRLLFRDVRDPFVMRWFVTCDLCCLDLVALTEEQVIQIWNTRVAPELVKGEMKSAEEWANKINEVLPALMEPVKCSAIINVVKAIQLDAFASPDKEVEEMKDRIELLTNGKYGVKHLAEREQLANAKIAVMMEALMQLRDSIRDTQHTCSLDVQLAFIKACKALTNLPTLAKELIEDREMLDYLEAIKTTDRQGNAAISFKYNYFKTHLRHAIKSTMSTDKKQE